MSSILSVIERQTRVSNYLTGKPKSPLMFAKSGINSEQFEDTIDRLTNLANNLDALIIECLNASKYYHSINCDNKQLETPYDKYRSSLDIWRHVKFFCQEVTIFDVMDSLWRQRENLYGQYCYVVRRRVFKTILNNNGWALVYDALANDEYKLRFAAWEGINRV